MFILLSKWSHRKVLLWAFQELLNTSHTDPALFLDPWKNCDGDFCGIKRQFRLIYLYPVGNMLIESQVRFPGPRFVEHNSRIMFQRSLWSTQGLVLKCKMKIKSQGVFFFFWSSSYRAEWITFSNQFGASGLLVTWNTSDKLSGAILCMFWFLSCFFVLHSKTSLHFRRSGERRSTVSLWSFGSITWLFLCRRVSRFWLHFHIWVNLSLRVGRFINSMKNVKLLSRSILSHHIGVRRVRWNSSLVNLELKLFVIIKDN